MLLAAGAHPDVSSESGLTPLICATLQSSTEIVRLLIAARANVNAVGPRRKTALIRAAENGNIEAVSVLSELGADPAMQDADGREHTTTQLCTVARV